MNRLVNSTTLWTGAILIPLAHHLLGLASIAIDPSWTLAAILGYSGKEIASKLKR